MLNSQIRSIISWWKRLCHKLLLNSALKAHRRIHILQLRVTFSNRMVKRVKALKATSFHRVVKVSSTAITLGKWRRLNLYVSLGIFLVRVKHWCTWNTWPIKVRMSTGIWIQFPVSSKDVSYNGNSGKELPWGSSLYIFARAPG